MAIFVRWCCVGRADRGLDGHTPDAECGQSVREGRSRKRPPRAGSEESVGVGLPIRSAARYPVGWKRRWRGIERTRNDGSAGQRQHAATARDRAVDAARAAPMHRRAEPTRMSYRDGYEDVLRTERLSRPERPQKMAPRARRNVVRGETGRRCYPERDVRDGWCAGHTRRSRRYGR